MSSYLSPLPFATQPGHVLVVHCSDNRFQAQFHNFLKEGLKLGEDYFLIAVPGAAHFLTLVEYLPKFAWAGRRWLRFLQKQFELERIILIGHEQCLWYEQMSTLRPVSAREQQESDLRKAVSELRSEFSVSAEAYFAALEDAKVKFLSV